MSASEGRADPWARSELWSFSLRVYAAPGVEAACLDLQQRNRVDVNLLLAACWAGASGRGTLGAERWQALQTETGDWQAAVVTGLRAVRKRLKQAADEEAVAALHRAVAGCELEAEHIEQIMIEAALPAPAARETDAAVRLHDAARNLHGLLQCYGCEAEAIEPQLRSLLRGSFPEAPLAMVERALSAAGRD